MSLGLVHEPRGSWGTPPKLADIIRAKMLWEFQLHVIDVTSQISFMSRLMCHFSGSWCFKMLMCRQLCLLSITVTGGVNNEIRKAKRLMFWVNQHPGLNLLTTAVQTENRLSWHKWGLHKSQSGSTVGGGGLKLLIDESTLCPRQEPNWSMAVISYR